MFVRLWRALPVRGKRSRYPGEVVGGRAVMEDAGRLKVYTYVGETEEDGQG